MLLAMLMPFGMDDWAHGYGESALRQEECGGGEFAVFGRFCRAGSKARFQQTGVSAEITNRIEVSADGMLCA
jgi:hypothetical protein